MGVSEQQEVLGWGRIWTGNKIFITSHVSYLTLKEQHASVGLQKLKTKFIVKGRKL
jgi:hypothetical protein